MLISLLHNYDHSVLIGSLAEKICLPFPLGREFMWHFQVYNCPAMIENVKIICQDYLIYIYGDNDGGLSNHN